MNDLQNKDKPSFWQCGRYCIDLSTPRIMGIVNMTPDSFSDGGNYNYNITASLKHAEKLLKEGADILDIGGESTRPGAKYISAEEEWQRIQPILTELRYWNIPISVDTRNSWVMQQLLQQQLTDAINDIQALEAEGAIDILAQYPDIGICLMHMQGQPENMQTLPCYTDVVKEVGQYLSDRVQTCITAGIAKQRLVIDPGFGFGKSLSHNIELMQKFHQWQQYSDCPVLVGLSRKGSIGKLINEPNPQERTTGSVVAAIAAVARGAAIVRVHDVRETHQGLQVWAKLGV